MFNSGILDVVIGLSFVYLILSLAVTAFNEFLEAMLKNRASDLERGLRELLNDKKGTGLVKKLYEHQLVFSLFKDGYQPDKTHRNLPSYIPARTFALALMDIILPARNQGASLEPLQELRAAIAEMDNVKVKQALLPLVDAADNDIDKARDNIEAWYTSLTERMTGWYKRRVQWITLVIGLIVAVVINVDTIAIGSRLSTDVSMRDSLVAATQEYAKASPSATTQPSSATPSSAPQIAACITDANSPECRVAKNVIEIQKLGLPMGWDSASIPGWDSANVANNLKPWGTKILGWILTALAISLGAPFWFDLLNKFVLARSTLKPTTQSPEAENSGT